MKHAISRGADAIRGFRESRPREFRWSIYGIIAGAVVGALVGGVGVAALGGALSVPAFVILAAVGGMIGNRIGVEKDNATPIQ